MTDKEKSQRERFIEAARKAGADEDPDAFKERLKKLVKAPTEKTQRKRVAKKRGT